MMYAEQRTWSPAGNACNSALFVMDPSAGVRAQTESASTRGTITDLTDASVTGVTVRLADVDRGAAAELKNGK